MSNKNAFIILGTDTGVGKTILTAGLLRAYVRNGFIAFPQKWVSTGDRFGFSEDVSFALDVAGIGEDILLKRTDMNPYSFVMPASPHFVAGLTNRRISKAIIKQAFDFASSASERLIVEGVGGALVPFSKKLLLIDLVKEFKLPVVLVVRNIVGAINHSLLTIEALHRRRIKLIGLVFNEAFDCPANVRKDNIETICRIGKTSNLGLMPFMDDVKDYDNIFDSLLEQIEHRV